MRWGESVAVRKGLVCFGKVGSVKAVGVRCGLAGSWRGPVRSGGSRRSRLGASGLGLVRRSWSGKVWLGGAW